jgi:hypothetical protein
MKEGLNLVPSNERTKKYELTNYKAGFRNAVEDSPIKNYRTMDRWNAVFSETGRYICGLCSVPHQGMNEALVRGDAKSGEEFREQRRRKRTTSVNGTVLAKNSNVHTGIRNTRVQSQVPTRNVFGPWELRWGSRTTKKAKNGVFWVVTP